MTAPRYEHDFHAWSRQQAELLRERRFGALDLDHLIEELEAMGARERRELVSRLKVLLAHLLKWQYQPQLRGRSWEATIKEQRLSLQDLIDENPSLAATLGHEALPKAYRLARLLAVRETDLDERTFPEDCPYTLAEVGDPGFYPSATPPNATGVERVPVGENAGRQDKLDYDNDNDRDVKCSP